MLLKERDFEGQGWMEVAQNHVQWWDFVHGDLLRGHPNLVVTNCRTVCKTVCK